MNRLFIYQLRATQPPTQPSSQYVRSHADLAYEDKWRPFFRVLRRRAAYRKHRHVDDVVRVIRIGREGYEPLLELEKPYVYRGAANPAARRLGRRIPPDQRE